jgi:hypothetical protein
MDTNTPDIPANEVEAGYDLVFTKDGDTVEVYLQTPRTRWPAGREAIYLHRLSQEDAAGLAGLVSAAREREKVLGKDAREMAMWLRTWAVAWRGDGWIARSNKLDRAADLLQSLASARDVVKDGWQLVPKEPTTSWLDALWRNSSWTRMQCEDAIKRVLAAAPSPTEREGG